MYTICQRQHRPNSMIQLFKIYRLRSIFCLEKTKTNETHLTENIHRASLQTRGRSLQLIFQFYSYIFIYFLIFIIFFLWSILFSSSVPPHSSTLTRKWSLWLPLSPGKIYPLQWYWLHLSMPDLGPAYIRGQSRVMNVVWLIAETC